MVHTSCNCSSIEIFCTISFTNFSTIILSSQQSSAFNLAFSIVSSHDDDVTLPEKECCSDTSEYESLLPTDEPLFELKLEELDEQPEVEAKEDEVIEAETVVGCFPGDSVVTVWLLARCFSIGALSFFLASSLGVAWELHLLTPDFLAASDDCWVAISCCKYLTHSFLSSWLEQTRVYVRFSTVDRILNECLIAVC